MKRTTESEKLQFKKNLVFVFNSRINSNQPKNLPVNVSNSKIFPPTVTGLITLNFEKFIKAKITVTMISGHNWNLIYTRLKQEKRLAALLTELNFECDLPLIKSVRKWHDRKKVVESSLFPSYLFVNITRTEDYFTSTSLSGFVNYVKVGKQIAQVNPSVV